MLRLKCPYCGQMVDETELTPGGEAHLKRATQNSSDDELLDYLFNRRNPKGVHFERWRHTFGCGKWFVVARCTVTHEVFGVYKAQTLKPPKSVVDAIANRRGHETQESQ